MLAERKICLCLMNLDIAVFSLYFEKLHLGFSDEISLTTSYDMGLHCPLMYQLQVIGVCFINVHQGSKAKC